MALALSMLLSGSLATLATSSVDYGAKDCHLRPLLATFYLYSVALGGQVFSSLTTGCMASVTTAAALVSPVLIQ